MLRHQPVQRCHIVRIERPDAAAAGIACKKLKCIGTDRQGFFTHMQESLGNR